MDFVESGDGGLIVGKFIVFDYERKIQLHFETLENARANARGLSFVRDCVSIGEENEEGIKIIERWEHGEKVKN